MLDKVMKIIETVRDSMIRSQVFFSIMMMVTRNRTTKNTCNSTPTTIYCAVGEKSKFTMLHSNNSWHGKF